MPPRRRETSVQPQARLLQLIEQDTADQTRRPMMNANASNAAAAFELRFQSLFNEGRGLSFPCDAAGRVDLDHLSERARNNYLYARALIGRDYATPAVRPSVH
jgi:hypothetical protein